MPVSSESRTKPAGSLGCGWIPLVIAAWYIVQLAIEGVLSGSGGRLEQIICYGTLTCVILIFAWDSRKKDQANKRLQEERQRWKSACQSADVAIVSRKHYAYESYFDDYGDYHHGNSSHQLELKPTADQKAVNPKLTSVTVDVYGYIYEKLEKRDTVRIYYEPKSPMTFLLEDEI